MLSACGVDVPDAEYAQPLHIPDDAHSAPVGLKHIKLKLPRGETHGSLDSFLSCGKLNPLKLNRNVIASQMDTPTMREAFYNALETQGYDVTGNPDLDFDVEEDMMRTEYNIGARITDIKLNACWEEISILNLVMLNQGFTGEIYVEVEWQIYDALRRKTVYKTRTTGAAEHEIPNFEGIGLLIDSAFEMASHNLGTDKAFRDLIFFGQRPEKTHMSKQESRPRLFPQNAAVTLKTKPLRQKPLTDDIDAIRRTAVLIEVGGIAHGSGFFITKQGHILSNAHVVGDARRVRIVTADKKDTLIAEVIRKDNKRDVALLRLEKIPDDFDIIPLPIRLDKPKVSERVYAIGTPVRKVLQDTVTSGIISAHRYNKKEKQPYIQADVDIYGGNSGGPLLDANGNLIGMSVLGYFIGVTNVMGGLNWFIPIGDALETLDIRLEGKATPNETAGAKPTKLH